MALINFRLSTLIPPDKPGKALRICRKEGQPSSAWVVVSGCLPQSGQVGSSGTCLEAKLTNVSSHSLHACHKKTLIFAGTKSTPLAADSRRVRTTGQVFGVSSQPIRTFN
ncbi:hypothetical protein ACOSP7_018454 [Xanthoceras sorbifolium]